jgi:hypothetical protein
MKKALDCLLHIGNIISPKTKEALANSLIKVLKTDAGDAVKIAAIQALATAEGVREINISNSNFQSSSP